MHAGRSYRERRDGETLFIDVKNGPAPATIGITIAIFMDMLNHNGSAFNAGCLGFKTIIPFFFWNQKDTFILTC